MIIKIEKTKRYNLFCSELFYNYKISAMAKGIFAFLTTLPDNWKISKSELYLHFTENYAALDKAFKELEDAGYVKKEKKLKE